MRVQPEVGNGEVNPDGVKKGSLKVYNKSPRQLEEEKLRQLEMIKGKLK